MTSLAERVTAWPPARIGLVGDLILDRYTLGKVRRVSPEAPVPVLKVGVTEVRLGGAANVAANLASAGMQVVLGGVVGRDEDGRQLRGLLGRHGIDDAMVIDDPSRSTVVKDRLIARNQQMLRVDREDDRAIAPASEQALVEGIKATDPQVGVWAISDYAKGVVTPRLLAGLIEALNERRGVLLIDPKGHDYARYRGCSILTPNRVETEAATGLVLDRPQAWRDAAARLIEQVDLEAAVITLGPEGIYVQRRDGVDLHVPTDARAVYDVTGAGDTVLALLASALAAGEELFDAVRVANAAAGIVVGRLGTAMVSRAELVAVLEGRGAWDGGKIIARERIGEVLDPRRHRGEVIVFTNGCFDILHDGHVEYLHFARERGDLLVVGLNDDASVRRMKGARRPINPVEARAKVLAALADVDYVVPFGEDTPEMLVCEVNPKVLVKGEDWRDRGVVGREWVESHGGEVILAPLEPGRSTTRLLERIRGLGPIKP